MSFRTTVSEADLVTTQKHIFFGVGLRTQVGVFSQSRCLVMMTSLGEWAKSVPKKKWK